MITLSNESITTKKLSQKIQQKNRRNFIKLKSVIMYIYILIESLT